MKMVVSVIEREIYNFYCFLVRDLGMGEFKILVILLKRKEELEVLIDIDYRKLRVSNRSLWRWKSIY